MVASFPLRLVGCEFAPLIVSSGGCGWSRCCGLGAVVGFGDGVSGAGLVDEALVGVLTAPGGD